jgi:hypothetical protein
MTATWAGAGLSLLPDVLPDLTLEPDRAATTCQVYAGTLVVPCPNRATDTVEHGRQSRPVCRAHR